MSINSSHIRPPRGLWRWFWRFPIWLYRARLGWLLTGHFIMLEHIGRKSGQVRRAVLEVVKHDRASDVYYLAAGFGSSSDWYQNLLQTPRARIHSGFRRANVAANVLSTAEAEEVIIDYARRFPTAFRTLARILGYDVKKGETDYREFAEVVPIVALQVESKLGSKTQ